MFLRVRWDLPPAEITLVRISKSDYSGVSLQDNDAEQATWKIEVGNK